MKIDFRASAHKHVLLAKEFLAMENDNVLRAACLELRMAIEALTYQNLQTYIEEVEGTVMGKWQPRRVIDELLYIDPYADQSVRFAFGSYDKDGNPPKNMTLMGVEEKFTTKWANRAHQSLSNFLHEPTIAEHRAGKINRSEILRKKIESILAEIDPILKSPICGVNIGTFIKHQCVCGFNFKRKKKFFEDGKILSCVECGRLYDYGFIDDILHIRISTVSAKCPEQNCTSKLEIENHLVKDGLDITCSGCGSEFTIEQYLGLKYRDESEKSK